MVSGKLNKIFTSNTFQLWHILVNSPMKQRSYLNTIFLNVQWHWNIKFVYNYVIFLMLGLNLSLIFRPNKILFFTMGLLFQWSVSVGMYSKNRVSEIFCMERKYFFEWELCIKDQ